jgi:DNA (cytosine-5)-methyltransferase 1
MTRRPRLLDAFCGEGGAGMGYHRAGFDVVGVDLSAKALRRYPFPAVRADAVWFIREHGHEFDAIHASPPCQSESTLRHRTGVDYLDLLTPTLDALQDFTAPWIVENVASTRKLPGALILCGTEFDLSAETSTGRRWLKRHRRFGSNVFLTAAGGCYCSAKSIAGIYGDGGGGQQTRGFRYENAAQMHQAMGTPWMSRRGMSQAIPPAYTEFLGAQLIDQMRAVA